MPDGGLPSSSVTARFDFLFLDPGFQERLVPLAQGQLQVGNFLRTYCASSGRWSAAEMVPEAPKAQLFAPPQPRNSSASGSSLQRTAG